MIDATLQMLRARREEKVAITGVVCALFADDLDEAVRRLDNVAASARECIEATDHRRDRRKRRIYQQIASCAEELKPWVEQMAGRHESTA